MGQFNGDLLKIGNWQHHFMEESLNWLYILCLLWLWKKKINGIWSLTEMENSCYSLPLGHWPFPQQNLLFSWNIPPIFYRVHGIYRKSGQSGGFIVTVALYLQFVHQFSVCKWGVLVHKKSSQRHCADISHVAWPMHLNLDPQQFHYFSPRALFSRHWQSWK